MEKSAENDLRHFGRTSLAPRGRREVFQHIFYQHVLRLEKAALFPAAVGERTNAFDSILLHAPTFVFLRCLRGPPLTAVATHEHMTRHFTVNFLVGEGLEDLKQSHLALQADDLIPEEIMQEVYGKGRDRQVSWVNRAVKFSKSLLALTRKLMPVEVVAVVVEEKRDGKQEH